MGVTRLTDVDEKRSHQCYQPLQHREKEHAEQLQAKDVALPEQTIHGDGTAHATRRRQRLVANGEEIARPPDTDIDIKPRQFA